MEEGDEGAVGGGDRQESEKPPDLVAVDHSLPTTTVQIRLSDGSRGGMLLIKCNEQHINISFLINSQPPLLEGSLGMVHRLESYCKYINLFSTG